MCKSDNKKCVNQTIKINRNKPIKTSRVKNLKNKIPEQFIKVLKTICSSFQSNC